MPETLTEYIANLKAEKQAADIATLIAQDKKVAPAFRRGLMAGLQLAFPGDAGLMAERGPAEGLPVQMPGDPYSGGE